MTVLAETMVEPAPLQNVIDRSMTVLEQPLKSVIDRSRTVLVGLQKVALGSFINCH